MKKPGEMAKHAVSGGRPTPCISTKEAPSPGAPWAVEEAEYGQDHELWVHPDQGQHCGIYAGDRDTYKVDF